MMADRGYEDQARREQRAGDLGNEEGAFAGSASLGEEAKAAREDMRSFRNDQNYSATQGTIGTGHYSERYMNKGQGKAYGEQEPRGYQHSDDRILEEVHNSLSQQSELLTSEVNVEVSNGIVTLAGRVPTIEHKQTAEALAGSISGVQGVINNLQVTEEQTG
jgi:hypothetical protein